MRTTTTRTTPIVMAIDSATSDIYSDTPHNSVCERFHGTVLHEFYRPHFHRGRVDDTALLDRSLQTWLVDYNQHRPNHGHYMAGRTPQEVKKQLRRRIRKTAA